MTWVIWIAVVLLTITSTGMLISRDWRLSLGLLGLQYIGVLWLVAQYWPLSMAAIKLVTGWMAIATLGITQLSTGLFDYLSEEFWSQGQLFRIIASGFMLVIVGALVPRIEEIVPGIKLAVISGSLVLIGMGLLHLGISAQPLRIILGLLTVLSGFEIVYAALESSLLVAALLAVVDLGLALTGAFILTSFKPEVRS
jgi:hypothetical protein